MPFIFVCVIAFLLFRMPRKQILQTVGDTFRLCRGAFIALCFGISMVYLYRHTDFRSAYNESMLLVMARFMAELFRSAYILVAPLLGVLGAFMSGSNAVSNTLFTGLQYNTAKLVNLSAVAVVALQNIGGAAGNMICINNIVAVCATTKTIGHEGKLIRLNLIPCAIYCLLALTAVCLCQSLFL